jgi:hypothetical protein
MSADAAAWFCEHVEQIRRRAERSGLAAEVAALAATIEDGGAVSIARIRDLSRALGGPEPELRYAPRIPGVEDGEPPRVEYQCPHRRCTRVGRRTPGGPVPVCGLGREPMTVRAVSE